MDILNNIGFSSGDLVKILYLTHTATAPINAAELHRKYNQYLPGVQVGYEYVSQIGRDLELAQAITYSHSEQKKKFYTITERGHQMLQYYEQLYRGQFTEIRKVFDRLYHHLTKNGPQLTPPDEPLPTEFRRFFAKLISVRDVTRYMIFYIGERRSAFYPAEALEQMEQFFGWKPSNGYFYDIVREMEGEGTITGKWNDPDKRTKRIIQITGDGVIFAKRIREDLTEQVANIRLHLNAVEEFFQQRESLNALKPGV